MIIFSNDGKHYFKYFMIGKFLKRGEHSIQRQTNWSFELSRVKDRIWVKSRLKHNGEIRVLLVISYTIKTYIRTPQQNTKTDTVVVVRRDNKSQTTWSNYILNLDGSSKITPKINSSKNLKSNFKFHHSDSLNLDRVSVVQDSCSENQV